MTRSLLRPDTQVSNTSLYNDNLSTGSTLESAAVSLEDDLNGLRTQVNNIISATGAGNWYDAVPTVNTKTRGLFQLNTSLDALEEKKLLARATVITDITVTAAQNWMILSVASSQAPTAVAAVTAGTTGAVVAQSALSGAGFNAHELTAVSGGDVLNPKNLCLVKDGDTGDIILSSGRQVYALLQFESTGANGAAFNDTSSGNRVKLSFVRPNATADGLEAVTTADIQGKKINYSYVLRYTLSSAPESAFLSGQFVDQTAPVDVTLQNAVTFQGVTAVTQANNININLNDSTSWDWRDVLAASLFKITGNTGGSASTVTLSSDVDVYTNNALVNNHAQGAAFATSTVQVEVGKTSGTINSTGANDLRVLGARELFLDDGNRTGSTWATLGIKVSDTTAEWNSFESAFGGEVSLMGAILQASASSSQTSKTVATVTTNISANTNCAGGTNLSNNLGNYASVGNFLTDVDVFFNGQLLRNGADASANNDVYPGTTPANGDLKFEFNLKAGSTPDVITMFVRT